MKPISRIPKSILISALYALIVLGATTLAGQPLGDPRYEVVVGICSAELEN